MIKNNSDNSKQMHFASHRTIADFLNMARTALLAANIKSAQLDGELLLRYQLNLPRTWLLAHDDAEIAPEQWEQLCQLLYLRSQHCPLAYLTGHKEFYGRDFIVNSHVLIPRPESEQIIESLKSLVSDNSHQVRNLIDIGTGSGCLAITAKLELPGLTVAASDIDQQALMVAKQNAKQLNADISFYQSDLLKDLPRSHKFDIIIANLPYVNHNWPELSPELNYEPSLALYDYSLDSLGLIKKMIVQAQDYLAKPSYLILEMDRRQIHPASNFAVQHGYTVTETKPFTLTLSYSG